MTETPLIATPTPSGDLVPSRRAVNFRSVCLGLFGVVVICGLTPYNDYALNNSPFIGGYLPVCVTLLLMFVMVFVNAPLHRWLPARALQTQELAVALGMMLVGCALPSSGLMRYLPISLVGPWYHAGHTWEFQAALRELDLPDWMFPSFASPDVGQRTNDPVVRYFYDRAPAESDSWSARIAAVPWTSWIMPAATWGIFLAALYGAVLSMAVIVRRQWSYNERLPFPLATIYLALIAPPTPGRAFNNLLGRSGFWFAFITIFILHGLNSMHRYAPTVVPRISLTFDLTALLSNPPWTYADSPLKVQTLCFTVVGIAFLIRSRVSFSLWFFFVAYQFTRMGYGARQVEFSGGARMDQMFGACAAIAVMVLWLGRRHWLLVLAHMFGRAEVHLDDREVQVYRVAGWCLVLCVVIMVGWLVVAGMTLIGAAVLVVILAMVYIVIARVVAETGFLYAWVNVSPARPWLYLLNDLPFHIRASAKTYFFSAFFHGVFTHDLRESLPVYSTHAMKISQDTDAQAGGQGITRIVLALVLALTTAYVASGVAMLYVEYSHSATSDRNHSAPINRWGAAVPERLIMTPVENFLPPKSGTPEAHNRLGHVCFGASITAVLAALRVRFVGFPLDPIGFLVAYTYPLSTVWFSFFIGWLAKSMIVHFGGTAGFRASQPWFIGIILGEAGAAACWLVVNLALAFLEAEYFPTYILPI